MNKRIIALSFLIISSINAHNGKTVLVSVSDKTNVVPLVKTLLQEGYDKVL